MRALEAGAAGGDAAAAGAVGAAGSGETRGQAGVAGAGMVSVHDFTCSSGVMMQLNRTFYMTMIVCAVCLCKGSKKVEFHRAGLTGSAWETLGSEKSSLTYPHLLRLVSTQQLVAQRTATRASTSVHSEGPA